MIPIGYLSKLIVNKPDWLKSDKVKKIYSVSPCMSKDFCDYINYWKHNGYWLFDSVEIIMSLYKKENLNSSDYEILYYEAFEKQYDDNERKWKEILPEKSFETSVDIPQNFKLLGYDVATYSCGNTAECSPLSII